MLSDEPPRERPQGQQPGGEAEGRPDLARARRGDAEHMKALARARRVRVARVTLGLLVGVVLVLFILWNSQPVKVNFVFLTRHPPLIWVMLACAVLGGVLGYLVGRPGKEGRRRKAGAGGRPGPPETGTADRP